MMVCGDLRKSVFVVIMALFVFALGCDTDTAPPQSGDVTETPARPFDDCGDGLPPDAACFARTRAPASEEVALARAIADRQLALREPESLKWDWGEAVLMLGLHQLARVTGEARYADYGRAWIDHYLDTGRFTIRTSDTVAPVALAILLYGETGDERYRAVIDDAFDYFAVRSLRTEDGGLNHLGVMDVFGISLWVDSLFMFGNVMNTWGELTGDAAPLDDFVSQFAVFAAALQDSIGFFRHATVTTPEYFPQEPDVYWGRGNGWVVAAGYDHLRIRRNRGEDAPAAIRAPLEALVAAAIATQDGESGLWWTVLNRPGETYLETSVAALFAFGLARGYRYGYLDDTVLPVIRGAIEGVRGEVVLEGEERGMVEGISHPTNVGDFEYYKGLWVGEDLSYGVGAVLLALTEAAGLPF